MSLDHEDMKRIEEIEESIQQIFAKLIELNTRSVSNANYIHKLKVLNGTYKKKKGD